MTTTMLATITAPPMNIVHSGARIAASAAVVSQAHTNTEVAIIKRASCDSLRPATAPASTGNPTTLENAAGRPMEDVMATAPPPDPPDTSCCASVLPPAPDPRSASVPTVLITYDILGTENLPVADKPPPLRNCHSDGASRLAGRINSRRGDRAHARAALFSGERAQRLGQIARGGFGGEGPRARPGWPGRGGSSAADRAGRSRVRLGAGISSPRCRLSRRLSSPLNAIEGSV